MSDILRHGDVLLTRCDLPKGAKEISCKDSFVVQEGETTGHKHVLVADPKDKVKVFTKGNVRYYTITMPGVIRHEEHKELVVSPGTYRQDQERELDHFSHTVRKVID